MKDSAVGAWVSGAIYRTFKRNLHFGLQLRFSAAEITLNEEKMEAGGFHILFLGGYHW